MEKRNTASMTDEELNDGISDMLGYEIVKRRRSYVLVSRGGVPVAHGRSEREARRQGPDYANSFDASMEVVMGMDPFRIRLFCLHANWDERNDEVEWNAVISEDVRARLRPARALAEALYCDLLEGQSDAS